MKTMAAAAAKYRKNRNERGFTLVELMVVLLIIGILLAIAIPTFLGAKNTANARAAESNLRNALTAEKTYYASAQAYTSTISGSGAITSVENALQWVSTTPTTAGQVFVTLSSGDLILLAKGADGNCYSITDDASIGTLYGKFGAACSATLPTPTAKQGSAVSSTAWYTLSTGFPS